MSVNSVWQQASCSPSHVVCRKHEYYPNKQLWPKLEVNNKSQSERIKTKHLLERYLLIIGHLDLMCTHEREAKETIEIKTHIILESVVDVYIQGVDHNLSVLLHAVNYKSSRRSHGFC